MSVTVTLIGKTSPSGAVSTIALPSYNQAAGNCIVVAAGLYQATVTGVTDTAGNTYVKAVSQLYSLTSTEIWYAKNCLGNASNVISIATTGTGGYSGAFGWDVAGVDKISPLDVAQTNGATSNTPTVTISTTAAAEAVIFFNGVVSGYATGSAGTNYTSDGNVGQGGDEYYGQHRVTSSTLSSEAQTCSLTGSTVWGTVIASFKAAPTYTTWVSDNFQRANETPLSDGGMWTASNINLVSDKAQNDGTHTASSALWTGSAIPDNQESAVTLGNLTSGVYIEAIVRSDANLQNYYTALFQSNGSGVATTCFVRKYLQGLLTAITSFAITPTTGDVFAIKADGQPATITVRQNSTTLYSGADSVPSVVGGRPGFAFNASSPSSISTITAWQANAVANTQQRVQLASDSFANLSNWSNLSTGLGTLASTGSGVEWGSASGSYYEYSAATFPNDQYSEVTLATVGTTAEFGAGVRGSSPGASGNAYLSYLYQVADQMYSRIYTNGAFSGTTLASGNLGGAAIVPASGQKYRMEAQGTTIRVFLDNILMFSSTDSTYASGKPCINVLGASASTILGPWTGGTFGYLVSGNAGEAGATITAVGALNTYTATADGSGNYSMYLPNDTYTITPTETGYTFSPTNASETVSGSPISGVNFTGSLNGHTISGSAGVAGATVSYSGTASGSVTADGSGNYSIPSLADGSYTITPSETGYTFSPTSSNQTVSGANITGVNFTATQIVVATPTFSPVAGTYNNNQTVTVSCTDHALGGFAMYYTTDGSTPTTGSTSISNGGTISVTASETIKVLAVATGYANSNIASATYTLVVATPTFSPDGGLYMSAQTVTISSATTSASIYYTTDGTTPTSGSTAYSTPISVPPGTTLKAFAQKTGYTDSGVYTATYSLPAGDAPVNINALFPILKMRMVIAANQRNKGK